MSLRDDLSEWTDWDVAEASLAKHLGLIDTAQDFGGSKVIFWSNNTVGNTLMDCLIRLADAEVLNRREEPDIQFRWNPSLSLDDISAALESDFMPGDTVRHRTTGEIGHIVSTWDEEGVTDCYVAFFGNSYPEGKPVEKPYILRYCTSTLEQIEPKQ